MSNNPNAPDEIAPEPALTEEIRKRIVLEERLKNLSKPTRFGRFFAWAVPITVVLTLAIGIGFYLTGTLADNWEVLLILPGLLAYVGLALGFGALVRNSARSKVERELAAKNTTRKTEELQEKLDENFFTNLVKINFKYIDQYYLQTQLQADKSFLLCAIAACTSLIVILAGVVMLSFQKTGKEAGYVAAVAGTLGEFISAVFFYLYNQTITKMGEYHQKLVLTQNISLALKISEDLPSAEQIIARGKLIDYLSKDINLFLTAKTAQIAEPTKMSSVHP